MREKGDESTQSLMYNSLRTPIKPKDVPEYWYAGVYAQNKGPGKGGVHLGKGRVKSTSWPGFEPWENNVQALLSSQINDQEFEKEDFEEEPNFDQDDDDDFSEKTFKDFSDF